MPTDIVLDERDGNWLQLDAAAIHARASDFMLDQPARRRAGSRKPFRRALVHDEGDGLTINFGNDYPGGVTINNVAKITPAPPPARPVSRVARAVPRRNSPDLLIEGGVRFKWFASDQLLLGHPAEEDKMVSLQSLLQGLQDRIDELEARVQALEAR